MERKLTNFAFIFARGGSKGVPRKNIKDFAGKPLITHSIELALSSSEIDKVIVSTEDDEIAEIALNSGAEVPFLRPAELAQDNSPEWLAWQHACTEAEKHFGSFSRFISLPATAPLRKLDDVHRAIDYFDKQKNDIVLTTVEAKFNPHFTLVRDSDQGVKLFSDSDGVTRRQDAQVAHGIVPVAYVTSPEFILSHNCVWDGKVGHINVDHISGIDIDDHDDYYLAELVAKDRQNSLA